MNLTQQQIENIQIDYGLIFLNYGEIGEKQLGPTRGGGTFDVTKSIRDIEFDGRRGKTKGMQVLDELNASIKCPLLDMSLDTLAMTMPYASYDGTKIQAKSSDFGRINTGAYLKNVALLARVVGGGYKLIMLYNAMSESDFSFTAAPKSEGVVNLEINAHWDAEDDTKDLYDIIDVESLTNDTVPPTLTTIPAYGSTVASTANDLQAIFSEQIREVDVNASNFILIKASDGTTVPGSLSYNSATRTAIFNPTNNLEISTNYIWSIARVRDISGNMIPPKIINFTTMGGPVSVTSFEITSNTAVEVGATLTSVSFSWSIVNIDSAKTVQIYDVTNDVPIAEVTEASGSKTVSVNITKTETGSPHQFRLRIVDGNDTVITSPIKTVGWYYKVYYGNNSATSVTSAQIKAMANGIKGGYTGSYTIPAASGYKYICYPKALGLAVSFKEGTTDIGMETPVETTVVNDFGLSMEYYIYRTTASTSAAITIMVA